MPSITDYIVFGAFIYYILRGLSRGFLRTVLGPVSLIIGIAASYVYYIQYKNFLISLIISVAAPFAVYVIVSLGLKIWNKAVKDEKSLSLISRIAGACLSTAWSGGLLILTLALITLIPGNIPGFHKVQEDVLKSLSYKTINHFLGDKLPHQSSSLNAGSLAALFENPSAINNVQTSKDYKDVMSDEQIKSLLDDPETLEQIKNQDMAKLLANPKMQAILQDRDLLMKLFALQKEMLQQNMEKVDMSNMGGGIGKKDE